MERTEPLDGLGPQLLVVLIEVAPYIFRFRRTSGAGNGSEEAPGLGEEVSRTVSHTGTGKLSGWQLSARVASVSSDTFPTTRPCSATSPSSDKLTSAAKSIDGGATVDLLQIVHEPLRD